MITQHAPFKTQIGIYKIIYMSKKTQNAIDTCSEFLIVQIVLILAEFLNRTMYLKLIIQFKRQVLNKEHGG